MRWATLCSCGPWLGRRCHFLRALLFPRPLLARQAHWYKLAGYDRVGAGRRKYRMSAQRAVRARPSKKQPAEWPAECTKRSLTQDEIAEFDGRVVDKCFPVLNEETAANELVWYSGKIKHMKTATMPFVFKITYDVDNTTETECYEGFRARDYYNFPDKAREPSQSPSRSKPLTDAQIREFNGHLVGKAFLTSQTNAITHLGLLLYAPASAGVREHFSVIYGDAYKEEVYYEDLKKEGPYLHRADVLSVLANIVRVHAEMFAEKARSASDRSTPTFRALAAYATFTRTFADAAAAAISAPGSPEVLELARRVADEARAYKALMPRGYLQQPTSSLEMIDAPSSNVSSITGAPPMPAVAPAAPRAAFAAVPAAAPAAAPRAAAEAATGSVKRKRSARNAPVTGVPNTSVFPDKYGYRLTNANRRTAIDAAIADLGVSHVINLLNEIKLKSLDENKRKVEGDLEYIRSIPVPMEAEPTGSASVDPSELPEEQEGEFEVDNILNARGEERYKEYLVKWSDFPGSAKWEPAANLKVTASKAVEKYETLKGRLVRKAQRTETPPVPAHREALWLYRIVNFSNDILNITDLNNLNTDIEKYHAKTSTMKEFVFLLEAIFQYYDGDEEGFKHALVWAKNSGNTTVLGIKNVMSTFTVDNIFKDGEGADKKTFNANIKIFRRQYPDLPPFIHRRNYITEYRFDAKTSAMMPSGAHERSKATITNAHKTIFDEDFLGSVNIQTMPYGKKGECTCYLCGKPISVGKKLYTKIGELDHIIPKTVAFIMNVIDTPLNYSPAHRECNGHKSKNLPVFSISPDNMKYAEIFEKFIAPQPAAGDAAAGKTSAYNILIKLDKNKHKKLSAVLTCRRENKATLESLGIPPNASDEDLRVLALEPRPTSGGALSLLKPSRFAQSGMVPPRMVPSSAPYRIPQQPARRIGIAPAAAPVPPNVPAPIQRPIPTGSRKVAPVYVSMKARPTKRNMLQPARVAIALNKVFIAAVDKPIVTSRDVLYITLLANLVDFYSYLATDSTSSVSPSSKFKGMSGGEQGMSEEESEYFKGFNEFSTGDTLMSPLQRREFMMFRYKMMYHFSLATYYESGAHAEYARQGATEDNPAYAEYILRRLDNCLEYFMNFRENPALLY